MVLKNSPPTPGMKSCIFESALGEDGSWLTLTAVPRTFFFFAPAASLGRARLLFTWNTLLGVLFSLPLVALVALLVDELVEVLAAEVVEVVLLPVAAVKPGSGLSVTLG